MTLINLTPHTIRIKGSQGYIVVPPSGEVARVEMDESHFGYFSMGGVSVPVCTRKSGRVVGLPEPKEGVSYLVSSMVLDNLPELRDDVYAPDTGKTAERDENGQIVAVTRLIKKG